MGVKLELTSWIGSSGRIIGKGVPRACATSRYTEGADKGGGDILHYDEESVEDKLAEKKVDPPLILVPPNIFWSLYFLLYECSRASNPSFITLSELMK